MANQIDKVELFSRWLLAQSSACFTFASEKKTNYEKTCFLLRNLISHKLLQAYLLEILELQKLRKNYLPAGGLFFSTTNGGVQTLMNWYDIAPPFMYCVFHHISGYSICQGKIDFGKFQYELGILSYPVWNRTTMKTVYLFIRSFIYETLNLCRVLLSCVPAFVE